MRQLQQAPARFISVPCGEWFSGVVGEIILQSEVMVGPQSFAGGFPQNWTSDIAGAVAPGVLDAMFPAHGKAW